MEVNPIASRVVRFLSKEKFSLQPHVELSGVRSFLLNPQDDLLKVLASKKAITALRDEIFSTDIPIPPQVGTPLDAILSRGRGAIPYDSIKTLLNALAGCLLEEGALKVFEGELPPPSVADWDSQDPIKKAVAISMLADRVKGMMPGDAVTASRQIAYKLFPPETDPYVHQQAIEDLAEKCFPRISEDQKRGVVHEALQGLLTEKWFAIYGSPTADIGLRYRRLFPDLLLPCTTPEERCVIVQRAVGLQKWALPVARKGIVLFISRFLGRLPDEFQSDFEDIAIQFTASEDVDVVYQAGLLLSRMLPGSKNRMKILDTLERLVRSGQVLHFVLDFLFQPLTSLNEEERLRILNFTLSLPDTEMKDDLLERTTVKAFDVLEGLPTTSFPRFASPLSGLFRRLPSERTVEVVRHVTWGWVATPEYIAASAEQASVRRREARWLIENVLLPHYTF